MCRCAEQPTGRGASGAVEEERSARRPGGRGRAPGQPEGGRGAGLVERVDPPVEPTTSMTACRTISSWPPAEKPRSEPASGKARVSARSSTDVDLHLVQEIQVVAGSRRGRRRSATSGARRAGRRGRRWPSSPESGDRGGGRAAGGVLTTEWVRSIDRSRSVRDRPSGVAGLDNHGRLGDRCSGSCGRRERTGTAGTGTSPAKERPVEATLDAVEPVMGAARGLGRRPGAGRGRRRARGAASARSRRACRRARR